MQERSSIRILTQNIGTICVWKGQLDNFSSIDIEMLFSMYNCWETALSTISSTSSWLTGTQTLRVTTPLKHWNNWSWNSCTGINSTSILSFIFLHLPILIIELDFLSLFLQNEFFSFFPRFDRSSYDWLKFAGNFILKGPTILIDFKPFSFDF